MLENYNLLIVGFPVYAWKIVEPIEHFLKNLPKVNNAYAASFATYGGVTIGRALMDAGKLLTFKGYTLLGAAKIVTRHSTIFYKNQDPFYSHPNDKDMILIEFFIKSILNKIKNSQLKSISLKKLNSSSNLIKLLSISPIAKRFSRKLPPGIKFNDKKCIKCGLCAKNCPVNIINLNPFPKKTGICIKCHNCKRVCPSVAIITTGIWRKYIFHIGLQKLLIKTGGEKPWSKIFL